MIYILKIVYLTVLPQTFSISSFFINIFFCMSLQQRWNLRQNWGIHYIWASSVQFSHSVVSDSLRPHGLQHTRLPCPSPTSGVYSNSCPSSWWCHPAISSSVIAFSSRLQSSAASGSFPVSQFFTSSGQSIGASPSASVLPNFRTDFL